MPSSRQTKNTVLLRGPTQAEGYPLSHTRHGAPSACTPILVSTDSCSASGVPGSLAQCRDGQLSSLIQDRKCRNMKGICGKGAWNLEC